MNPHMVVAADGRHLPGPYWGIPGDRRVTGGQLTLKLCVHAGGQVRGQDGDQREPGAHHPGATGGHRSPADRQQREDGYRHHAGERHRPGPGAVTVGPCRTHGPALAPSTAPHHSLKHSLPRFLLGYCPPHSPEGRQAVAPGPASPLGGRSGTGQTGCRVMSCSEGWQQLQPPWEHSVPPAPGPSPPSPSVTAIYCGQDLPIKLFPNLLPSPLLCVHSPRGPHAGLCQPPQGGSGGYQGTSHPLGNWGHVRELLESLGCWLLEKTRH